VSSECVVLIFVCRFEVCEAIDSFEMDLEVINVLLSSL